MPDAGKTRQQCIEELAALRSEVDILRKSETKRLQIEEALRKSEHRYRAVVSDQTELISPFLPDFTHAFALMTGKIVVHSHKIGSTACQSI